MKKPEAGTTSPEELNAVLNGMLKEIMGKRTASTIAKKCGVSVSTITRIRNGENKRGISEELLHKIWLNRDSGCEIDLSRVMSVNSEMKAAYMQKETADFDQERREMELLERQIQKNLINSGVFLRKTDDSIEIIPGIELYPEMSYEIAFDNGEKRRVLIYTQFHSKRRIDQMRKRSAEDPGSVQYSCRHYRTIMDFQELRKLHSEYENSELVIVFNYDDDFAYNADVLQMLSNRDRVSLALIEYVPEKLSGSGRLLKEVCLDGRKTGIFGELDMIKKS